MVKEKLATGLTLAFKWDSSPGIPWPTVNLMRYWSNKRSNSIFSSVSKPGTIADDPEGSHWKIINQYVILKNLGSGSYGEVKLCYDKETKWKAAMKIVNLKKMRWLITGKEWTGEDNLLEEIAIMKKLNHPNVIDLIEVIEEKSQDELYIIMEFAPNGTVASQLAKGIN